jgi:L-alanine-DL-glutamate epimerase-like enolase superfamily enzyme
MSLLTWEKITLKLRNPFHVAYGVSDTRDAYWIRLANDEGWGEGTIPPYYRVDSSEMTNCWQRAAEQSRPLPDEIDQIAPWIPDGPAPARCALELALLDRIGKRKNEALHALLGLDRPPAKATCFTIGIDSPDAMARMARRIENYPMIKLKLGSGDSEDEARVRAVREARPDAKIVVDANAGWSFDQALAGLRWLEGYRIELIEQPLPKDQHAALGELQKRTAIPVVADESVQSLDDVKRLGDSGVRGVNLKLMKLGGLLPAIQVLNAAREYDMKIMLGCMIETSIGITAMAHLMGSADWLDLDAPLLISNDPFDGVRIDDRATIQLPVRPGIGVVRKQEPHP